MSDPVTSIIGGGLGLASSALGLFGGEDRPSSSTDITPLLYPRQEELLDTLLEFMEGQFGQGVPSYPGRRVAPMSPAMERIDEMLMGFLGGEHPTRGMMMDRFEDIMQPFSPEETQQWWEGAVKQPALRTWRQDVVPDIMEEFAGLNALDSGASRRAVAESGADVMGDIDAILANTMFGERQAHRGRQLQAMPQMMQYEREPLAWLGQAMPISQMGRGVEQQQLTADYQDWLMEQPYANPWLEMLLPYLLSTYQTPTRQYSAGGPNIFGRAASAIPGLFGGGAALYGGLRGLGGGGGGGYMSPMNSSGLMVNMPW